MRLYRSLLYALVALGLSLGAPLGWLALRALGGVLTGGAVASELQAHAGLYVYLLVATGLAFSAFGFVTGRLGDTLQRANQRLADLALTDGLTGLKNARYFHERLREEVARARRRGEPLALIVGDLDHFKRINDEHGHPVGDRVLVAVGQVTQRSVRAADVACRIGGEEFGIVCPNTDVTEAMQIGERWRAAIEAERIEAGELTVHITLSVGIAVDRGDWKSERLFRAADAALYEAKGAGRNRVVSTSKARTLVRAQALQLQPTLAQILRQY
jgi:diguanylate cyclase (GGDEF)-like protein